MNTKLLLAVGTLFCGESLMATVLTFDDVTLALDGPIPNGYGGLNWTNMYVLNSTNPALAGSGYDNGTVSGEYVAFNWFANIATASNGIFDFNGAYLTGAWRDGLSITVTGFFGAAELYTQTVVVDHDAPTWFGFNYLGIDRVEFESFGGVEVPGLGGEGAHFAMDNFTINEVVDDRPTSVPDGGSTLVLLGGAIGAFRLIGRRLERSAHRA